MNDYRTIPLSGKHAKDREVLISKEDYDLVSKFSWYLNIQGYAVNTQRIKGTKKKKMIYMHRLIMGLDKKLIVDHINHDTIDNRRENLRLCTYSENLCNKKPEPNSKSSFKGVTWSVRDSKWVVQIWKDGRSFYYGYHENEIDAAKAYNEAAKEHHGEYAYLNDLGL